MNILSFSGNLELLYKPDSSTKIMLVIVAKSQSWFSVKRIILYTIAIALLGIAGHTLISRTQ